jgi:hypothetical protein
MFASNRQDLNSSIMTGSDRIVDNTTFAELGWGRDPFAAEFFILAPGFQKRADLFPEDFVEVLKDIHALQCIQDLPSYTCQNPIEMCRIDNQQASIGSRLVGLPKLSAFMEACYLGAYLSACMLCSKVWRHSVMPVSKVGACPQNLVLLCDIIKLLVTPTDFHGTVACITPLIAQAARVER